MQKLFVISPSMQYYLSGEQLAPEEINRIMDAVEMLKSKLTELTAGLETDPVWGEVRRVYGLLRSVEDELSLPATDLHTLLNIGHVGGLGPSAVPVANKFEYAGMNPLAAAKAVLKKIRRIFEYDEIVAALERGGCSLTEPERVKLATSLTRSTVDVYKVRNQLAFGWFDYFSNAERGRKKVSQDTPEEAPASEIMEDKAMAADAR
jgi:hypothetical protein